ncbi:hypothetical protein [Dyadobacter sp. CY323]|uniref:hypothetical protein n=1 Tax=Dyadobacter sp. CY323 TaxID=2907302 RepID=UPI001F238608|nr:hypothetical protein [Dyadobacter sp. CY323]MCE6992922.1 hypothetical protein [Dyadobacter sp. CY323]
MRNICLIFLFSFLSCLCVFGQEISNARWISTDTTVGNVQVIAYWNKGEKMKYRGIKTTKQYQGDSLMSEKTEFDAIVQFEVSDSTANSYGMTYRMLENLRETSKDPKISFEDLNITDDDLILRYTTDTNGTLERYTNRDTVESKLGTLMAVLTKETQSKMNIKSEAERKAIADVVSKLANGKTLFANLYEPFISQFHNLMGYRTGLNDTLNYQETILHSITEKNIQFDCYVFVSSLDSLGEARFDLEKFADMKDFGKDYVAFLQKTREANGLQKDLATDADVAGLDMKMETYVTTYIDLDSGWPTYLKITRSVGTTPANAKQTSYKDEVWILTNDLESK